MNSSDNDRRENLTTLELDQSGTAILYLGSSDEKVITLNKERMESLKKNIETARKSMPSGLVITSKKEGMFCAGADVSIIHSVSSATEGEKLAREGQEIFDMIENLPFKTVAAINGVCLGGGYELALACDFRVAGESARLIGLPEVKLGIIPGFGGTQRLPRLIGLPKALDVILNGKAYPARKAYQLHLIDAVFKDEELTAKAIEIASGKIEIKRRSPSFIDRLITNTNFGRRIVTSKTERILQAKTKGFYPAPPKALKCCTYGLEHGVDEGLKMEAKELGNLIVTDECKGLTHVFFLTEASKSLGKPKKESTSNLTVYVIGAGTMGAGIAALFAKKGYQVILRDRDLPSLERGMNYIKEGYSKGRMSHDKIEQALKRIKPCVNTIPEISNADIVIEAVFEDLSLKQEILEKAAKDVSENALIATNTSSLSIEEIASVINNPDRVVGMHFFNPVLRMPLLEIVRSSKTSADTILRAAAIGVAVGKYPIVVEDVPGFLVNRILFPYLNEAMYLLMEGYSVEDIDRAAVNFGMPMGPIRLLDEVGLDVAKNVAQIIEEGYGERMSAPKLALKMVEAGRLGRKNKRGFYDYINKDEVPSGEIRNILEITEPVKADPDYQLITERLIFGIVNEAFRALDEGVAGKPSKDAMGQIDLGSVMGFGFPPFRGGVMYYAMHRGTDYIADKLSEFSSSFGERFKPSSALISFNETFPKLEQCSESSYPLY